MCGSIVPEKRTPPPPAQRTLGYYALPVLWGDRVVGWGNCTVEGGRLRAQIGTLERRIAREPAFREARDAELSRMAAFLDRVLAD